MYEAYFHLQKHPFAATPDSTCFFAPDCVQEAVDELILRSESGQGIGLLMAPAGTGKTLVCRRIASELAGRFSPVFLANANVPTKRALLQSILYELGRRYSRMEEQELRLAVYRALKELALAGRGAVIIVDEAHLLSDRLLEELRLLASLSEQEEPLARLILAGQLSLEERLVDPALEALNQRVVCHAYLEPLTRAQSIEYVAYRMDWAGGDPEIFTPGALDRIASAANGLPRCLNHLCDQALLLAYAHSEGRVSPELVDEALLGLRRLPLHWNTSLTEEIAAAMDDRAGVDDENDEVRWEQSSDLAEAGDVASASACIEIGGAAGQPVEEELDLEPHEVFHGVKAGTTPSVQYDSVARTGGCMSPGVVPLSEPAEPAMRGFIEEVVEDRYAALDRSAPRIYRTFDDALVPEVLRPSRGERIPEAPEPLVPREVSANEGIAAEEAILAGPDLVVDQMLSLIDQVQSHEALGTEQGTEDPAAIPALRAELHATDVVEPEPEFEIPEEQLESGILDACLEVQTAVGRWDDGHGLGADLPTSTIGGAGAADELAAEYDVIQPDRKRDADAPLPFATGYATDRRPAERYVPKPKYRHVFSALRRRLGLRREM